MKDSYKAGWTRQLCGQHGAGYQESKKSTGDSGTGRVGRAIQKEDEAGTVFGWMQWELLLFAGIKREEMIMELKAIFLDIDNTLLDFDAAAQQSMEESFHKFGLSFHPEMMSIFNEENDKIWQRIEKKELSIADLPHVRWQTILPKLGLQADGEAMESQLLISDVSIINI